MKTKLILMTLFTIFGLVSCEKENQETVVSEEVEIDTPTIVISTSEQRTATASFRVNMPWTLVLTDTKATPLWFTIDKMSGDAGAHTITLTITEANPSTTQARSGYIKVVAGSLSSTITVIQQGSQGIGVTSVSLNKSEISLVTGGVETLIPTINPTTATNKNITWSSSNEAVATVINGVVTAKTVGTATITVRTEDGNKEATCTVTVTSQAVVVTSVILNKNTISLVQGGTETLTPTINPTTATNKNITWSSSNEAVATVINGVVTAKAVGTATISVRTEDGNKEATCMVTVTSPIIAVTSVILNKNTMSLVQGGTETLTPTINPATATNKNITWLSSNEAVATVINGVVTAKAVGTATITVRTEDGNKEATCTVTVIIPVTNVYLNKSNTSIAVGSTETLIATINPVAATNKNVTWSSSDSKIATVSATGVVTATAAGIATITVSTVDGNKRAACNVTVIDSSLPDRDNEGW